MAPNPTASQHELIQDIIISGSLTSSQMAEVAPCSTRSIKHIRANLRRFNHTTGPRNGGGRPRSITSPMLDALLKLLLEEPDLYLDELVVYLWDEFEVLVQAATISRALTSIGRSKKIARQVARERNADLIGFYLHNLSFYRSYHLVYVDESGCDKRSGCRRTGWSPLGVTPVKIA